MDDGDREEYQGEVRQLRNELRALRGGLAPVEGERPPRVTKDDMLRALFEERRLRSARTSRATVRLTRNAKGDVQPEVLVEVSADEPAEAVREAQHEASTTFDALCLVYSLGAVAPPANGSSAEGASDA